MSKQRLLFITTGGTIASVRTAQGLKPILTSEDVYKRQVLERCNNQYGKMWECPDFFPLDGKQVLMLGPMEMLPTEKTAVTDLAAFHNTFTDYLSFFALADKAVVEKSIKKYVERVAKNQMCIRDRRRRVRAAAPR